MKKHVKHASLTRPNFGFFHRSEWAILGTNCGDIQHLAAQIAQALHPAKVAYVDASHARENSGTSPFHTHFVQHRAHDHLDISPCIDSIHDQIALFESSDLVLINGNHFEGKAQILILDPEKDNSLHKRLARLTDVRMIVRKEVDYWPDFLPKSLRTSPDIKIAHWADRSSIIEGFEALYRQSTAPVYGLVLAGGKSTRMGFDKGKIPIKGKDARLYFYDLLERYTERTYLSIRQDQAEELKEYPLLTDRFIGLGPFGALLTAFQSHPDVAWLVVATDMMGLSSDAIEKLIDKRNPASVATAFLNANTGFPDPLATLWEPKAHERLMQFLRQGYSCPRKVLINSDIQLLEPTSQQWLANCNTPQELSGLDL